MTSKDTVEMFSKLFNKTISRSPVDWVDFEAGLARLGFMLLPRTGSVYTFYPPGMMDIQTPLVIHRPHQSRIEGYRSLIFSSTAEEVIWLVWGYLSSWRFLELEKKFNMLYLSKCIIQSTWYLRETPSLAFGWGLMMVLYHSALISANHLREDFDSRIQGHHK